MKTTNTQQEHHTECISCGHRYATALLKCPKCSEPNAALVRSAMIRVRSAIQRLERIRELAASAPVEEIEKRLETRPLQSALIAETTLREIGETLPPNIIKELACHL